MKQSVFRILVTMLLILLLVFAEYTMNSQDGNNTAHLVQENTLTMRE